MAEPAQQSWPTAIEAIYRKRAIAAGNGGRARGWQNSALWHHLARRSHLYRKSRDCCQMVSQLYDWQYLNQVRASHPWRSRGDEGCGDLAHSPEGAIH